MQNIIILLIVMVLMCGCVSERAVVVDKAHAELLAFWDKNESLLELFQSIGVLGYFYHNEMDDISFYTDTPPSPEVTHERRWFNCVGATRYFADFIKYKHNCDSYKMIMMKQRGFLGFIGKWHSVLVVKTGNIIYLTSNNVLSILDNENQYLQIFMAQGYNEFDVTEEWTK